ncbi:MAG: ribonuclease HI [Treponema sp.]
MINTKTTFNNSNELVVYTDGGCSGNPGPGGWGCVIIDGENEKTFSGGDHLTTNNKMELTAAIQALSEVAKNPLWQNRKIKMYSDSQYVKNGITSWIKNWKKNGWKTSNKKPVLNKDLWIRLDELYTPLEIEWQWVKGHAGVKYNEICDQLCQKEIQAQNK